jgi:glycosyltransferase involved in cell wall biosynthesis
LARDANDIKTILMAGRADDPLKGMAVLSEAGRLLWQERRDFRMVVTHYDHGVQTPWLHCAGWRDHAGAMALYAEADIVAVPSIWHEPFGLVAVEAMAHARPVVASDCGGLADIVRPGQTGFLAPPNNAPALAERLRMLLDDAPLRQRLGDEGRRVAAAEYDWERVIDTRYRPLIEELIT